MMLLIPFKICIRDIKNEKESLFNEKLIFNYVIIKH